MVLNKFNYLMQRGEEFVSEMFNGEHPLGDPNCLLVDEPAAATAKHDRSKQPFSQSVDFPSDSRFFAVAVSAHGNARRRDTARDAAPLLALIAWHAARSDGVPGSLKESEREE